MSNMVLILTVIYSIMSLHTITGEDCATKRVSIVADILEDTDANGKFEINIKDPFWHVSILKRTDEGGLRFLCGGSLVRRGLVVTAAGCVASADLTRLRATVGLALARLPVDAALYNVSEKYYPYRDNYTVEKDDLAILRLSNVSGSGSGRAVDSARLAVLPTAARLSKHCFTVGWGDDYSRNQMVEKCIKPSYKNVLWASLYQSKYSGINLKHFLDFRNVLGITKYAAFSVYNMLSSFQNTTKNDFPQISEEPICRHDEYSPLRTVQMSASGKLRDTTMCADTGAICLRAARSAADLIHKVDIGSPIFCKIKKPKVAKNCPQQNSSISQYVLAGVVTSKQVKDFTLIKYNTTISVMRATNVTTHSDFLLSVLNRKN